MIRPCDPLGSGKALRKAAGCGWKEWLALCTKRKEGEKRRGLWMVREGQASPGKKSRELW